MITFTRKGLIANTFLDDDAIDQILKNQDDAEKWSAFWSGFKTPNDKIFERLKKELGQDFSIHEKEGDTEFIFRLRKTLSNCQKLLEGDKD